MSSDAAKKNRFPDFVAAVHERKSRITVRDEQGKELFDASPFIIALILANEGWMDATPDASSLFLGKGEKKAREIGQEIYDKHGHEGMVAVHTMIEEILVGGTGRELEMAWDGIGDWRM